MMPPFHQLLQKLYTAVYPKNMTCRLCKREVFDGEIFCEDCRANLPYNTVFCPKCGRKIVQQGLCIDCKAQVPLFYKARSRFVYQGKIRKLILGLKNGRTELAHAFIADSAALLRREFFDAELITFIPMTDWAQQERGYNQSQLLAEKVSKILGKDCASLLQKTRGTYEQKALSKADRAKNLQGSFCVIDRKQIKDKIVLLIDDAMTTGATVEEVSRLLNGAGAKRVYVFTIASVYYRRNVILSNHHTSPLKSL